MFIELYNWLFLLFAVFKSVSYYWNLNLKLKVSTVLIFKHLQLGRCVNININYSAKLFIIFNIIFCTE